MKRKRGIWKQGLGLDAMVMEQGEYRASLNALNIFFGAVIGVTLGGVEDMPMPEYLMLLVLTSGAVMAILYVSNSRRRLLNSAGLIALLSVLYRLFTLDDDFAAIMPEKFMPTLIVWAAMTLFVEFLPREREAEPGGEDS